MKKILLAALIALAVTTYLKGQGLRATTYVEHTSVSPKLGTAIGYSFMDQMEVGGFFQKSTEIIEPEAGRPLSAEQEFYGAYFAYPLLKGNAVSLKFNVRTGVANKQNFVITPSLMASYRPLKNLSIGGGIGTRSFKPTYMVTISLRLNNKSKGSEFLASNSDSSNL